MQSIDCSMCVNAAVSSTEGSHWKLQNKIKSQQHTTAPVIRVGTAQHTTKISPQSKQHTTIGKLKAIHRHQNRGNMLLKINWFIDYNRQPRCEAVQVSACCSWNTFRQFSHLHWAQSDSSKLYTSPVPLLHKHETTWQCYTINVLTYKNIHTLSRVKIILYNLETQVSFSVHCIQGISTRRNSSHRVIHTLYDQIPLTRFIHALCDQIPGFFQEKFFWEGPESKIWQK